MKKIILTLIAFFSFVSPILAFKSDFVIINNLQRNEAENDLSEIEKTEIEDKIEHIFKNYDYEILKDYKEKLNSPENIEKSKNDKKLKYSIFLFNSKFANTKNIEIISDVEEKKKTGNIDISNYNINSILPEEERKKVDILVENIFEKNTNKTIEDIKKYLNSDIFLQKAKNDPKTDYLIKNGKKHFILEKIVGANLKLWL